MNTLLQPVRDYLHELWTTLSRGWDRFWFAPADTTTLAMIRIFTGLALFYTHFTTFTDVQNFIGPQAWIDSQGVEELLKVPFNPFDPSAGGIWAGAVSIWYYVQDPTAIWVLHAIFLVAIVCFTVGLFSRVAAVAVWFGHLSYIQRGMVIYYGLDTIVLLLTLYLMFAPIGRTLSVDRLIARYRRARGALRSRARQLLDAPPAPSIAANCVMRVIQVHMCIIYLCAGLAKLQGATWWNGTAIYLTLMTPEFALLDLTWMAKNTWVALIISHIGVAFTLFTEIGFAFLVWHRLLRPVMLLCAVLLQFGIGVFMGLGSFQLAMFAGLLAFVSPASMRWLLEVLFKGPAGYRYVFDHKDSRSVRAASWIHAADPWRQIEVVEAHEKDAGAPAGGLIEPNGAILRGYDAFERIARSLRILWPIAIWTFIPGVAAIGRYLYPGERKELNAVAVKT